MSLPPFPVDDATLLAVEHALGARLTLTRPDGAPDDGGPWVVGADYSLSTLLDFMAGTLGPDPDAEVLVEGHDVAADAPLSERIGAAPIVADSRVHYSEHDLIRALVAEVRRLRSALGHPDLCNRPCP